MTISSLFLNPVYIITNAKIQFGFEGTLRRIFFSDTLKDHILNSITISNLPTLIFGTPKTHLKCLTPKPHIDTSTEPQYTSHTLLQE